MLMNGNPVADKIRMDILKAIEECRNNGTSLPKLAILRVGERSEDLAYESRVLKNCEELGIAAEATSVNNNIPMVNFMEELNRLNEDPETHGILIFRPLPEQLDIEAISRAIRPEKDIDCMSPVNAEKIFSGDSSGFPPCTPEAVIEMLKYYQYDLNGKHVVLVNRSMVLGKPLSMMFLEENSTVTVCHSKTKNLQQITSCADIVVTGTGKGKFFGTEYFSKESVVIDVGINTDNGSIYGDVDFDAVSDTVAAISPVPGGVGTVTSMVLLNHVIKAMKLQQRTECSHG